MINKFLVFALVLVTSTLLLAQSSSTYSRFGIGDMRYSNSARKLGIGGIGVAVVDENSISTVNPAALFKMRGTRIGFELGLTSIKISDDNSSSFHSEADFNGFTFGFPVSEKYGVGVAAGIVPYSRISYKVKEPSTVTAPYTVDYEGKGGISNIFLGSSVYLPFNFSFGASLDYYFGNLKYSSSLQFDDIFTLPVSFEKSYRPTGFGTTVGILTPDFSSILSSESISNLRFGASLKYIPNLDTDTLIVSTSALLEDTVGLSTVKMELPLRVLAGVSLVISNKYLISADYAYQPWSEFKIDGIVQQNLRDLHKFSTGVEYKPIHQLGATSWEQMIWRAGISYEISQYLIKNQEINQFSVFAGFSYPMGIENSIDFAIHYSRRGSKDSGLIQEDIIKMNLGISFGEVWFLRFDQ